MNIEHALKCDRCNVCDNRTLATGMDDNSTYCVRELSKALLAERSEREAMQDVWAKASSSDTAAYVTYQECGKEARGCATFTRTLPKTRARQIAEEAYKALDETSTKDECITMLEQHILEYGESILPK